MLSFVTLILNLPIHYKGLYYHRSTRESVCNRIPELWTVVVEMHSESNMQQQGDVTTEEVTLVAYPARLTFNNDHGPCRHRPSPNPAHQKRVRHSLLPPPSTKIHSKITTASK
jgi:hypothetical protein